ncbi:MAG: glycosyltransferase [Planctomycetota bacterium]
MSLGQKRDVRVAALVVNYNTGSYAECCIESLLHEWKREGRAREQLEIVLVDNDSPAPQEPYLTRIEALGVKVIRSPENLGYARGMNLCYQHTSGAPGDVVAVLNPDLHFLPGALGTMIDYVLDHPDVGVIDPATSVDPLGVFNLPRNLLPTPFEQARVTFANMHPVFSRMYSRYRLRRAMVWWTSREPVETDMLSGCCLFLRREVVERMGRVMDPRYPLYFEDTDLFRTVNALGLKVVHHTRARILHHWSRSAKVAGRPNDPAMARFEVARAEYIKKFYGPFGRGLFAAVQWLGRHWPARWIGRPIQPLTSLGDFAAPVELTLPRSCRWLLELSVHPSFVICAGTFGEGQRWVCPPEAWEWLFALDYYVRVIDLERDEVLGCYHFKKTSDCREEAMRPAEIDALGERLLAHAPVR